MDQFWPKLVYFVSDWPIFFPRADSFLTEGLLTKMGQFRPKLAHSTLFEPNRPNEPIFTRIFGFILQNLKSYYNYYRKWIFFCQKWRRNQPEILLPIILWCCNPEQLRDPRTARSRDRQVRIGPRFSKFCWSGPRTRTEPFGSGPTGFGPWIPGTVYIPEPPRPGDAETKPDIDNTMTSSPRITEVLPVRTRTLPMDSEPIHRSWIESHSTNQNQDDALAIVNDEIEVQEEFRIR